MLRFGIGRRTSRMTSVPGWILSGASTDLDFADSIYYDGSGGTLSSMISTTRASTGYAQTSSGLLVPFASNTPRITDNGLLVEEARTNVVLWSQDPSNAAWTKTDVTIGAATTAPDGTSTALLATAGSAGTDTLVTSSGTVVASSTNSAAIYLKRGNNQWLRLVYADSTGTDGFNQWVDLTNGVLGSNTIRGAGTFTSASITAVANGFYRVVMTGVVSTRTNASISVVSANANGSTTRVNGATYYPWQTDLQAGSFITSPILTTTASATRAADVITLTGAAATAALAAKAAYFETNLVAGGTNPRFIDFSGGAKAYFSGTTQVAMDNNTDTVTATIGAAGTSAQLTKTAYGFDATSMTAISKGGTKATDAHAVAGQSGTVYLANNAAANRPLNGYMRRAAFGPTKAMFDGLTAP